MARVCFAAAVAAGALALLGVCAVASGDEGAARGVAVPYDIVYVRQVRNGDLAPSLWTEAADPGRLEPGADLMLLHPGGAEEVLAAGGIGAVTDPVVSFDGRSVYYAYFHDLSPESTSNSGARVSRAGADIFRIDLETREIERLTFGGFSPNTGAGNFDEGNPVDPGPGFNALGYGVMNLAPCPLAGGRIAFSSNRHGFEQPRGQTRATMQLFVMDSDGANVECITPMTLAGAMHPTALTDGRIMFSTHENQGARNDRLWGIWAIWPDGRQWTPLISAFRVNHAFHFATQLSGGDLVATDYYNRSNQGFGALYRMPLDAPGGEPAFHGAPLAENPPIAVTGPSGQLGAFRMSFTPRGFRSITPFTHSGDAAAPTGADGVSRVGKLTHPAAAPNGDLLAVWTPGPANDLDAPSPLPYYDGGIYLIPAGETITNPGQLLLIKNDPAWNEAFPRAVVPYGAIHGVEEPAHLDWLPNDGSLRLELPAGTPHGMVGASSLYKRETFPGTIAPDMTSFDGLDPFNPDREGVSSNWTLQGADAGLYDNSDIWAVRVVMMEPNTHRALGPNAGRRFRGHAGERMRILGEIPLHKAGPGGAQVIDAEGNPDTSFLAKIPADTPFLLQTIDRNGMVLNSGQTWRQVRPGEVRNDCGGCHAHSQQALAFATTAAAAPSYEPFDLAKITPLLTRDATGEPALDVVEEPAADVEFYRDIRPILARSCVSCHTASAPSPPGALVLDDYSIYTQFSEASGWQVPGDYARLALDETGRWGPRPLVGNWWRGGNASRYIRKFQSRRSLLMWKLHGERLDGWTNDDHPTESVPGEPSTLPPGAMAGLADIDFTGTIMPPPGSGVPPLSDDEKMLFARWIDLGCPIDTGQTQGGASGQYGWFLDDLRPTLTVSAPRAGMMRSALRTVRIGMADAYSGLAPGSLAARLEVPGEPPIDLGGAFTQVADGVFEATLAEPLRAAPYGTTLFVEIADMQGNVSRVKRAFSVELLTGDITADGQVSAPDLARLLTSWGGADPTCDLNGDGQINAADLALLLTNWGP